MHNDQETSADSEALHKWPETLWIPPSLERQAGILELLYLPGSNHFRMAE